MAIRYTTDAPASPASPEEIDRRNADIVKFLKKYENIKAVTPLTFHNMIHSFECYFYQYSHALNMLPFVYFYGGHIRIQWKASKSKFFLDIRCSGPNFYVVFTGEKGSDEFGWRRREEIMKYIESQFPSIKFPIEPC